MKDHNQKLSSKCREIIECDVARISNLGGKLFLIIGFNRNTKDDPGVNIQQFEDGSQIEKDWDYVAERVVASGETEEELIESAEYYKKLCGMAMIEFLEEHSQSVNL